MFKLAMFCYFLKHPVWKWLSLPYNIRQSIKQLLPASSWLSIIRCRSPYNYRDSCLSVCEGILSLYSNRLHFLRLLYCHFCCLIPFMFCLYNYNFCLLQYPAGQEISHVCPRAESLKTNIQASDMTCFFEGTLQQFRTDIFWWSDDCWWISIHFNSSTIKSVHIVARTKSVDF